MATAADVLVDTVGASRTSAAIERADARLVRIPVDPPRGDAIQKFTALELPIVSVTAADGTGTGFGYTIGTGGHAILTLLRTELLPQLVGMDSRRIAFIHDQPRRSVHALTPGCLTSTALAAIDVALWDLAGHRASAPVWKLLGGARERVPVYNTHVGWLDRPVDEMVALCREAVERDGFRALKLKVGKADPAEDVERVARVRQAVGDEVALMIDANQSWTVDEAVRRLRRLESYDLVWIEEPLAATDVDGFVALGRHISIPRAGGESLYDPAYFADCVRQGALDILQPDVARVGGITSALEVCHLAAAFGLRVAPHVSPELSVSVAAAVPNSMFIEFIPQMEPILARTVRIEDGQAIPPQTPGHGIEFDAAALARHDITPR